MGSKKPYYWGLTGASFSSLSICIYPDHYSSVFLSRKKPPNQAALQLSSGGLFSLYNAIINRADFNAMSAFILIFALVAGFRIDDVDVSFRDRFRGTFRNAKPTGSAFIGNKHGHDSFLQYLVCLFLNISTCTIYTCPEPGNKIYFKFIHKAKRITSIIQTRYDIILYGYVMISFDREFRR